MNSSGPGIPAGRRPADLFEGCPEAGVPGRRRPPRSIARTAAATAAFFVAALGSIPPVRAEGPASVDLEQAVVRTRKDVEEAVVELQLEREKVAAARKPLAAEVRALQAEAADLRREADSLRAVRRQKEEGFENLRREVQSLREEEQFVFSLLSEYRREMETRAGVAEARDLAPRLEEVDGLLLSDGETGTDLKAVGPLLEVVAERNLTNVGGNVFAGTCLDERGLAHPGSFVAVGPITYFVSRDGSRAGLVGSRVGSLEPSLVSEAAGAQRERLARLAAGDEAEVPVDVTLGDAVKVGRLRESWFGHIRKGGVVMVPILGIGILCLVLAIWKSFTLRSCRTDVGNALEEILELLKEEKIDRAVQMARSLAKPVGPVVLEGIEHRHARREYLEEIIHERILGEIPALEKHLPTLAVCAGAAPLLGLLGTVTGMIHTFNLVTVFGTGDPRMLSAGISEALITTEYGLAVAIPILLIHAYLSRRVRKIVGVLEQTAIGFINGLKVRDTSP